MNSGLILLWTLYGQAKQNMDMSSIDPTGIEPDLCKAKQNKWTCPGSNRTPLAIT